MIPDGCLPAPQVPGEVQPAIEAFLAKWAQAEPAFIDYFKAEWCSEAKLRKWVHAHRGEGAPTTNGLIESYHNVIKLVFVSNKCVLHICIRFCIDDVCQQAPPQPPAHGLAHLDHHSPHHAVLSAIARCEREYGQ